MITLRKIFFFLVCLSTILTQLNESSAQNSSRDCETPFSEDVLENVDLSSRNRRGGTSSHVIRLFARIVNDDNGNLGVHPDSVVAEVGRLGQYFDPHNICFLYVGYDEINDSYYAEKDSFFEGTVDSLLAEYPPTHSDVISMYLLPDTTYYRGRAEAIPSTILTVTSDRFNNPHLAHELGHCVGLYHTHETAFGVENPTRNSVLSCYNCTTAGDRLCDTPADTILGNSNINTTNCTYTSSHNGPCGVPYSPSPANIMSYAPWSCRSLFTADQGTRMDAVLSTSSEMLAVQVFIAGIVDGSTTNISSGDHYIATTNRINIYGNYSITNSADVVFVTGDSIELEEGFEALPTSGSFTAKLKLCATYAKALAEMPPSNEPVKVALNSEQIQLNAFPNPFNDFTNIEFSLPETSIVYLEILDLRGESQRLLIPGIEHIAGKHTIVLKVSALPSGIYFCQLTASGKTETTKLILQR